MLKIVILSKMSCIILISLTYLPTTNSNLIEGISILTHIKVTL